MRSLSHNLDYKREKAGGFLVIYTPLYKKREGISFSSHLYQAGTPWADRSSEVATSSNENVHVSVCACMHVHILVHICVNVLARLHVRLCGCAYGSGGRYFPITALPVSHCSGTLFATLHD